ncbi:2247_t:CDS:1, partial [Racocetra persica]
RLLNLDIYPIVQQQYDFLKDKFLNNYLLNKDKKLHLLNRLQKYHDNFNVTNKIGKRRQRKNCVNLIYAVQSCEH